MGKPYVQATLTEEKKTEFIVNLAKNNQKAAKLINKFIDKFNENPKKVIKFIEET